MTRKQTVTPSDLSSRAMLVKLRLHRWGTKRHSNEADEEVAKLKHADPDLVRITKRLLKSRSLDNYRTLQRHCRKIHKFLTLPWDEGVGLLPAENYFRYTEKIGEKRREAQPCIDEFVNEYAQQWSNGMSEYKKGLGSMFNEGDYPEPDKVRAKFGIEIRTYPIQDPNDFRVKLSGDVTDTIKKQIQQDFNNDLTEAMRVPIIRLYECLTKVQKKLANGESVFRDTLIGNVQKLVDVLPALNVMNDPKISELVSKTDKEICSVKDMKALRKDAQYRKEVADSANKILKAMRGYMS